MIVRLYKVYLYRPHGDRQVWWEAQDIETGQGIHWSPDRERVIRETRKMGHEFEEPLRYVVRFYRTKRSA